jgi:hypothetical protein
VVRVPGYRSRGLGSIPGATRFSEKVAGLERGPLSLLSKTEELLGRKRSGSGLKNQDYDRRRIRRADHATPLYPQKLTLTSPSGCRSVGIVRSRTQATEFVCLMSNVEDILQSVPFHFFHREYCQRHIWACFNSFSSHRWNRLP